MVQLFEKSIRKNDIQSSKGNQLKWENDGLWYKADYTGYEGLSEYVISHLLKKSTLAENEYVLYDLEQIQYNSVIYNGVKSCNFLHDDWQVITLERLFKSFFGESLNRIIYSIENYENRLKVIVTEVERRTGLKNFGVYMSKLLTIDAFFLNEDRHTHNIAVLMDGNGNFDHCPIFDNGAALLADTTMDYPLGEDVYKLMGQARAKTICSNFDEQLDVAEGMYGVNMTFYFNEKDVCEIIDKATLYPKDVRERVKNIIFVQMRKYGYLFR